MTLPEVGDNTTIESTINLVSFLITNWKSLGAIGISAMVVNIVVSFFKTPLTDNWFGSKSALVKRLIVVILSLIAGILVAIFQGQIWYSALINALLTYGGALTIYESVKPFFEKK